MIYTSILTLTEFAAYLIDLKGWFPPSRDLSHRFSNVRRVPDEDDPWRKRALELEAENELLKLRAQKQELGKYELNKKSRSKLYQEQKSWP